MPTYLSPVIDEKNLEDVWECWYCGSLNSAVDASGHYSLKCVHCDGPRKLSPLEFQQYQERTLCVSHDPLGRFIGGSVESNKQRAAWSVNELEFYSDYYTKGLGVIDIFRRKI